MEQRHRAAGTRGRLARIALVALLAAGSGLWGCGRKPAAKGSDVCSNNSDCQPGYLCNQSHCAKICNTAADCPARDQTCSNGLCKTAANPACTADSDCTHPNDCQSVAGAFCRGGQCIYGNKAPTTPCDDQDPCTANDTCNGAGVCAGTPKPCTNAPANYCSADDSTYFTYTGTCDPSSGACSYTPTAHACDQCATQCLAACASLSCPPANGGCSINGVCNGGTPPGCSYDNASDRTPCALSGNAGGTLDGLCVGGSCVECITDADCTSPPAGAPQQCFDATCSAGSCTYTPLPSQVCAPAQCTDGFVSAQRTCGSDGSCPAPSPAGQSCNGFACNAAGDGCLTTCSSASDCAGGLACQPDHTCQTPKALGVGCNGNGECGSGFCVDGVCCNGACALPCQRCDSVDGTAGQCHNVAAGHDPDGDCTSTASNCFAGSCSGAAHCTYKAAGSNCGTCRSCGPDGDCKPNSTDHADCPTCEKCSNGQCVDESSTEDVKNDCSADPGCGSGNCNGSGGCDYTASGSQPSQCNTCKQCNGTGSCVNVSSGVQKPGCNAGAAANGCSGADSCDGNGTCNTNDVSAGTAGSCGTCQQCDGSGGCEPSPGGQSGPGCTANATACSGADTCDGSGNCQANNLANGAKGSCPTCQQCGTDGSGNFTCVAMTDGSTDGSSCPPNGCAGSCQGGVCSAPTAAFCSCDPSCNSCNVTACNTCCSSSPSCSGGPGTCLQ